MAIVRLDSARAKDAAIIALGRSVLEDEAKALKEAARRLNGDFARAVRMVATAKGRLVVSGMGKAGFVAQKIYATFASTGTRAHFLHPAPRVLARANR